MINRLPADVPETGLRYDLTLTGAGLDNRKRELAMFVVDNGPHRGVRVSAYLTVPVKDALIGAGAERANFSTESLDAKKFDIRLSAVIDVTRLMRNQHGHYVPVNAEYNATNVYVSYDLSDWSEAQEESELTRAFEKKADKFKRVKDESPADEVKPKAKRTRKPKAE